MSEKVPAALHEIDILSKQVKLKPRKIEVDDAIVSTLNKATEILNETFLRDKEL